MSDSGCGCGDGLCCGKVSPKRGLNRRQFLTSTAAAAGSAGLLAAGDARSEVSRDEAWRTWNASLLERGERRWYSGAELETIEMPLGGIGAGQVYLGGRGTLGPWGIVNNFNSMAYAPGSLFGVWTKSGGKVVARVLEEAQVNDGLPRVNAVSFAGEYPYAWIRFQDEALPVHVTMEAYSPMIPLNAKDSGLPAVVFRIKMANPTSQPVEASVLASMPNLIGWNGYSDLLATSRADATADATGSVRTPKPRHMNYIGNTNRTAHGDSHAVLELDSQPGALASIADVRSLVTNVGDVADALQLCENLTLSQFGSVADGLTVNPDVYWLGPLTSNDLKTGLRPLLTRVNDGATLVVDVSDRSALAAVSGLLEGMDESTAAMWRDALPVTWRSLAAADDEVVVSEAASLPSVRPGTRATLRWRGEGLRARSKSRTLISADDGTPLVVAGPHGNGRIILALADFTHAEDAIARKEFIGATLAYAANTTYTPQQGWPAAAPFYGTMTLAALDAAETVTACAQWDDVNALWSDFAEDGRLNAGASTPSAPGQTWNAALSVPMTLAAGEERHIDFVLTWHFPNRMRDFRYGMGPQRPQFDYRLGNQYNNWFANAREVFDYVAGNFERLERETRLFHATFYDSTLPHWLLDAVTANASIIRSPIIMWLEDGTVAGFEGTDACCPMNCTHVYNYAMSMAFLFPELERRVREIDLLLQMNPEGFIPHRTLLPLSLPRLGNTIAGPLHHALDGELGTILKTYREWRHCGDDAWLVRLWPNMRKVMRHVFDEHDADGDGVIKGEQPNTYDIHTYGSNTFIGSLYLTTLRATEEMARHLQDPELANECRTRFESGRKGYDERCWNGEYYEHRYDAPNATPEMYEQENSWGPGCHADQLLGQWWANILDLGYMLPQERVDQALRAIHTHNFRRDFNDHHHNQRVFAEGDEMGMLCCTWPHGGRPKHPVKYCDEVWTGIEYHVAASLIADGRVDEGLQIARAARDRYTGDQRNPWSEVECGGHYARAMASYSLLLAAGHIDVDARTGCVTCAPKIMVDDFKAFFTSGNGWGSLTQHRSRQMQRNGIELKYGTLTLGRLTVDLDPRFTRGPVTVEGPGRPRVRARHHADGMCMLEFDEPVRLTAGDTLTVRFS